MLSLAASCTPTQEGASGGGGDSTAARGDSAVAAESTAVATAPPAADTGTPAETSAVARGDSAPPLPPPPPRSEPDPVPTYDELAELRAGLVMPLAGVNPDSLASTFTELRGGGTRSHEALDVQMPRGTPVRSAAAGRVLKLHTSEAGGLMVYASDPSERFVLLYGHLDGYADGLRDGSPLRAGETIGYVGTTGNAGANNPHLHFAIARVLSIARWWGGTPVDPLPLLQRPGAAR